MLLHTPQHRSTPNIENLDQPILTTRNDELPILPECSTPRSILEPRDRLDHLPCLGCIDQDARRRSDGIVMWFGGTEMDVVDGRGVLDE